MTKLAASSFGYLLKSKLENQVLLDGERIALEPQKLEAAKVVAQKIVRK
tara:strand:+ start:270 stop:416 length:147 start_codon:yes stop_codon:yes gene_type:complete